MGGRELQFFLVTQGLKRYYGHGDLHYVTCSCFQRRPFLGSADARDVFLAVFEETRRRYVFDVIGYVVMPEHFHVLMTEPRRRDPSIVMKALKQTVARKLLSEAEAHFWHKRFYDFNVFSKEKQNEKIHYMHDNPVKRGLVSSPELWKWSSFRAYTLGEDGLLKMDWLHQPLVLPRIS